MKIIKLTAENIKKLRAVEITPKGDLVEITGKNGAGKSSVLDAIWWALCGATHIQSVPIRKGAKKARIKLDLGELIVERRFTDRGSTLVVENAEGTRCASPQAMVDAIVGAIAMDPLEFVQNAPDDQYETLRNLVNLDVDLDELDAQNVTDYDKRTDVKREAGILLAQAGAIAVIEGLPAEPVDVSALMDEMAGAATHNAEIETRKANRAAAIERIAESARQGDDLRAQVEPRVADIAYRANQRRESIAVEIARLEQERTTVLKQAEIDIATARETMNQQAAAFEEVATGLQTKIDKAAPLPDPIDVDDLRRRIGIAQADNKAIEQRTRKQQLTLQAKTKTTAADQLTQAMEAREEIKREAIASAKMPVEGLGFGAGIVTFNGIPFDQASTAEQLRVSVAIAMAANPKLRVLRIKHGNDLDADNLALLADMAKAGDYQVWIERVESSGKVGIVIEDGSVVAVDGEPVAPATEAAE